LFWTSDTTSIFVRLLRLFIKRYSAETELFQAVISCPGLPNVCDTTERRIISKSAFKVHIVWISCFINYLYIFCVYLMIRYINLSFLSYNRYHSKSIFLVNHNILIVAETKLFILIVYIYQVYLHSDSWNV